ncbi:unnamed protein product [Rhizopus stolonifer]
MNMSKDNNKSDESCSLKIYNCIKGTLNKTQKVLPEIQRARSSSVGSILPSEPNFDTKQHYDFNNNQKSEEITVKEIKQEGIRLLLHSIVPLGYFLYYLLSEYSSENLFFYLAVDNYQHYNFSNQKERKKIANKIVKVYLTKQSELEVNLEDRIYRTVQNSLLNITTGNEFDAAKRHILDLLNISYFRFKTSSIWAIMESKCSSYSTERSQLLIVNLLLSCQERKNAYDKAISRLLCSFCRVYLPIGHKLSLKSVQETEDKKNYRFDLLGIKFSRK